MSNEPQKSRPTPLELYYTDRWWYLLMPVVWWLQLLIWLPQILEAYLDKLARFLSTLGMIKVMEHVGKLTVLVVLVMWFLERDERTAQRIRSAWQVLYSAHGKAGDGGRREALQTLIDAEVSLRGLPMAGVTLLGLTLPDTDLSYADFSGAQLQLANFAGRDLVYAKFIGAALDNTFFNGARLLFADFSAEDSTRITLLINTQFTEAFCPGTKFRGAQLYTTDFTDATLIEANFRDCTLVDIDFSDAILNQADFRGAKMEFRRAPLRAFHGAELHWADFRNVTFIPKRNQTLQTYLIDIFSGAEGLRSVYFDEDICQALSIDCSGSASVTIPCCDPNLANAKDRNEQKAL